jgi:RNA polymerase sigma-70 factor, ECF subfamily
MGLSGSSGALPVASRTDATVAGGLETQRTILVERAQAGDREAFEALLDRWLGSAFRIAYAILGDEADARDATQDAFLRGARHLRRCAA